MGLASSQARLLSLTARMHDIEYKAQNVEAQKLQMANESDQVYQEYEDALNKQKVQLRQMTSDGTTTFIDATYNNLTDAGYTIEFIEPYASQLLTKTTPATTNTDIHTYNSVGLINDTSYDHTFDFTQDNNYVKISEIGNARSFEQSATYLINDENDLIKVSKLIAQGASTYGINFELTGDIDLTNPIDFLGLGNFEGTFNGNGFEIKNLNRSLCDTLNNAEIKNLVLEDINITGDNSGDVGVIAATSDNSVIDNCTVVNLNINLSTPDCNVGGLIGLATDTKIMNSCCYRNDNNTAIKHSSSDGNIGGLIGKAENYCYIENSYTDIKICNSGSDQYGYIVGADENDTTYVNVKYVANDEDHSGTCSNPDDNTLNITRVDNIGECELGVSTNTIQKTATFITQTPARTETLTPDDFIAEHPELGSSTEWLSEMLQEGIIVLQKPVYTTDENNDQHIDYIDVNVATDTDLREESDEVALKKAEAKYEADMRKIDAKDKKYDTTLASLENERNAIKTEMDTLKTVEKDNVDRTYKLFG